MKIAFIFAHPDDEAFGPAGTICKLASKHEVFVMSLCNGYRPGANVQDARCQAFMQSCDFLGATPLIWDSNDCTLDAETVTEHLCRVVNHYKPDIIYTHSLNDVHRDHRLVAEGCLVASRPKPSSSVDALYFSEVVPSTGWGMGQFGTFAPNVYSDVTEVIDVKRSVIELYDTEVYQYPDARSVQNVINTASVRGSQCGVNYAEAFQLVFSRDHKID